MKQLIATHAAPARHWVGDGFPVRNLFNYRDAGVELSPFLLFDYAGPYDFAPTGMIRGVGEHPHRGFETVTIVFAGEVDHRDSAGGGGRIGPGDVQWMTAARGLVHEEKHSPPFARRGGRFEMAQLWVNLPARDKLADPRYQGIPAAAIPVVTLPGGAGTLRVIAGEHAGQRGPALTFSPVTLWDLRLAPGVRVDLTATAGHTAAVAVLSGSVRLGSGETLAGPSVGTLERDGTEFALEAVDTEAHVLFLGGRPLDEPIAGHGPFVMNTDDEIRQAMDDFQAGRMGTFAPIAGSER